ncbi:carboxymuconolactone decarboxylase family protein [Arenibacter sp. F20364]|uniref:carboxymuconolactone decarboxylase family protein n=1 Tax=Arenibacter sp. F20364 TaxID=2926415 RepID=UPI001FF42EDE|nr:carboxymuconolactone decarboxylase family protein [Arenibacter sp. F20364]MCK0189123.1 carboxymuconolactone decarboxylase family protein [Arenibacter sp. F20364]
MERISYRDIPKGMFENLMTTEDYINSSSLETHLLELIRLRVAQKNGCAYCVDMHHKELKFLGETDLRLSSLCVWKETPYFTEKEMAALNLTDVLTKLSRDPLSETVFDELTPHFNKEEICYLTLAISQINTWNRLMKTFKFTPGNYQIKELA